MNPDLSILAEVFGRYADIQAVYLFGSRALRAGRVDSDGLVDVDKLGEGRFLLFGSESVGFSRGQ